MMEPNDTPTVLRKGDVIINKLTNRPIKVGSRTYMDLVRNGTIQAKYEDPHELAVESKTPEAIKEKIKELNATLPNGMQAVRGRGQHAGKIVKRTRPITGMDATKYTAKVASQAVAAHITEIMDESGDDEDLIGKIESLILQEMTGAIRGAPPKRALAVRGSKRAPIEEKYIELAPEPEPEQEDESDEETPQLEQKSAKVSKADNRLYTAARKAVAEEEETELEEEEIDEETDGESEAWANEGENWDEE